jgi:hypothetical protein
MIVTKALATVKNVESSDPNGEFELILSAPTEDRDSETVDSKAFEPLPDHLSMDIDHGMSVATTVGSGVPSYNDAGELVVKGTYASTDLGQTVRTLVNEGHIRTASVAYIPKVSTKAKDGKRHITKAELLNGAFTPVPANKDAKILTSKSGARNSKSDMANLQTAHDSLVAAGAACSTTKHFTGAQVTTKAIVGSVEALQERVSDALQDAHSGTYSYWGYLRGVIPNATGDGGTVVFQSSRLSPNDYYESCTYRQDYTDDGAVVTLVGDPVEVDIHEIVAPDADADREAKSLAAPDPTATAAGSGAAGVSTTEEDELQTRLVNIRGLALTALTT